VLAPLRDRRRVPRGAAPMDTGNVARPCRRLPGSTHPGGAYIQPFTLWNTAAHRPPGLNPLCVPVSVVTAASSGRLPNLPGRLLRVEIEDLGAEVRPYVESVRTFVGPRPSCVL
jgi:hypothetical protein